MLIPMLSSVLIQGEMTYYMTTRRRRSVKRLIALDFNKRDVSTFQLVTRCTLINRVQG